MKGRILTGLIFCLLAWLIITGGIYRFIHPEMTETQLLLHTWDAVTLNFSGQ